ncbi:putative UDP-glucuronate:xylan alpha-glucuronosyltransferase 4, partial [Mucuna pruriens]
MASNKSSPPSRSHLRRDRFLICLLLVALPLVFFVLSVKYTTVTNILLLNVNLKPGPQWFHAIAKDIHNKTKIKLGLVNIDATVDRNVFQQLDALRSRVETVSIGFDRVHDNLKWEEIFPEWIDENGIPECPHVPMPAAPVENLDVVVAKVPCGIRDVFRLQVNLVVANLAVESGWVNDMESEHRNVYVVFVGSCGPMVEIFRCDDVLLRRGGFSVYKPDLRTLKQQMLMPVGSCQIAPTYAQTGKEVWRDYMSQTSNPNQTAMPVSKRAYVTVLHSSEAYVCGAIALAQSIQLQSKTTSKTIDLLLLADKSIGPESTRGLRAAGWKIRRIQRIKSPFAKKGAYNEWNYSKLRIWNLTTYHKVIFIDSDLLVLRNIDHLFVHPQLSAAPNEKTLFNSGLMVIEPSQCTFENMMNKTSTVRSYNGGDQGFLNEIFTWWHRLPRKVNHMKSFRAGNEKREMPDDVYTIHYLGLKPWMCYRDYDCNWDMQDHHVFASDSAHEKWWRVYDAMPKELQSYCGLTQKMNKRIVKWRRKARNATLSDGHWKIKVQDPRRDHYRSD